ncbi:MAG TPA: 6-phosphogluconolactonase [Pyrinomonadaceae bacterium]|nr:6-phosphogluconolactonase [Pyrinomonadaceae bacterium]
MSNRPTILIFEKPEEVALAAAERFVEHAQKSIDEHKLFSVALSGGNTPRLLYELLAQEAFQARVDWSVVHTFFGDERMVPSDHPASNSRMAREALLSRVPIPQDNVHPIKGVGDAVTNAGIYESELRSFFSGSEWPRFDLVLLGLGKDGHTASLFPGTNALAERRASVVANWIEDLRTYRITLTAPAVNAAANVDFLVTGADKAQALAAVLEGPSDPELLPAQLIRPESGSVTWLVDRQAASELSSTRVQQFT